jgi:hypothetical protein
VSTVLRTESTLTGAVSTVPGAERTLTGEERTVPGAESTLTGAVSTVPGTESTVTGAMSTTVPGTGNPLRGAFADEETIAGAPHVLPPWGGVPDGRGLVALAALHHVLRVKKNHCRDRN